MPAYYEYGFQAEGPAWHGMGTNVSKALSIQEALATSGLDWTVAKQPMYYKGPVNPDTGKAKPVEVPGHCAVVKQDGSGKVLGVHSNSYQPINNIVAFDTINHIMDMGAQFNSAGALKDEKVIWVSAMMPDSYKVLGDDFQTYFFFGTSHDGSMAFVGGPTNIRIVCWNTFSWAKNGLGKNNVFKRIKHTRNAETQIKLAANMWKGALAQREEIQKAAETLYGIEFNANKWDGLVEDLFPIDTEELTKRQINVVEEKRSSLWVCLNKADLANFKRTGWGFVQGVADFADHSTPVKQTATWKERRMLETVNGSPLVAKAYDLVMAHN